ncbi:hypothetical protein B0H67DRAFT_256178 [Lasiosphaeris hirsuta]|uniref:Uncharacterized protein n=1 Tax=Lasiosphaeris hirsuta TaxID=260670 RepID=A0AA40AHN8_9PEZI|nr:hypothetical protein B0H67DRAFT_256178 [Lasiosphaeris hirsuta]
MLVGVGICDFLELFRDHIDLIPPETVATQGRALFNLTKGAPANDNGNAVTDEDVAKADLLLKILKKGSEIAPWMRSSFNIHVEKLDRKTLDEAAVRAFDRVEKATTNAIVSLRRLEILVGPEENDISADALAQSLRTLGEAMKEIVPLYNIATKENDKNKANLIICSATTIAGTLGSIVSVIAPPVGIAIGWAVVIVRFVTIMGSVGMVVNGVQLIGSTKLRQKIFKTGDNCHQIWLFLTLVMMRMGGRIPDGNDSLVKFAQLMAKTFNTVDVMNEWNDSDYVNTKVDVSRALLEKSVGEVKERINAKRRPHEDHEKDHRVL